MKHEDFTGFTTQRRTARDRIAASQANVSKFRQWVSRWEVRLVYAAIGLGYALILTIVVRWIAG